MPGDRAPRIARLTALAIHFHRLIREGKVKDYAEIAAGLNEEAKTADESTEFNAGIQEPIAFVMRNPLY